MTVAAIAPNTIERFANHLDAVQVVLEEGDGRRRRNPDDEAQEEGDTERVADPIETERAGRDRDHEE